MARDSSCRCSNRKEESPAPRPVRTLFDECFRPSSLSAGIACCPTKTWHPDAAERGDALFGRLVPLLSTVLFFRISPETYTKPPPFFYSRSRIGISTPSG